jgi:hypothetical protein
VEGERGTDDGWGRQKGEQQIATEYWERVRRGKMKGRDKIKRRIGDIGEEKKRGKQ